jgi:hypothetical protein
LPPSAESVRNGEGQWSSRDRLILRIVDEQLATYTNEPQTINDALEVLSVEDLVEVLIILGTYALIARVINGLKIEYDFDSRPKLTSCFPYLFQSFFATRADEMLVTTNLFGPKDWLRC